MTLHHRPSRTQRKLRKRGGKPDSSSCDNVDRDVATPVDTPADHPKLGFLARRGWGSPREPAKETTSPTRRPSPPHGDTKSTPQEVHKSHGSWHTIPPSQVPASCYSQLGAVSGMHVPSISIPPSTNVGHATLDPLPSSSPKTKSKERKQPTQRSQEERISSRVGQKSASTPQSPHLPRSRGFHPLQRFISKDSCDKDEEQPEYLQYTEKVTLETAYARLVPLTRPPSPLFLDDDNGGLRGAGGSLSAVRQNRREGAANRCEKKVVVDKRGRITLHCGEDSYQIVGHISTGVYETYSIDHAKVGQHRMSVLSKQDIRGLNITMYIAHLMQVTESVNLKRQ